MLGLSIENRKLKAGKSLSGDLANHIRHRYNHGKIAIITPKPVPLMSATRKQWQGIIRQIARQRSSTLNPRRIEFDNELMHLQQLAFTAIEPIHDPQSNVSFATIEQFLVAPPICHTLYITCHIEKHELYMATAWIPPHGLVVFYD
jgi:hypothetical protein